MPRFLPLSLTLILIAGVSVPANAATDYVLCRAIRLPRASASAPAFRPFTRLSVADRFTPEGRLLDVRKPTPAATLTIEPPVSLKVLPPATSVPVGGEQQLHVTAKLLSGVELDLGTDDAFGTGYVNLISNAPAVVRDVGACAPVEWLDLFSTALARAQGVATISAHYGYDSGTELTSTATGGDATITVTAP